MNVYQNLVKGNGETWFGTLFFSVMFGLLFIGFIAIISSHKTSCYYPQTLDGSNTSPFLIKGNVNWEEDYIAYRFDSADESRETLKSLVQCASK